MPKEKTYEYDYEWNGQEEKAKGVVLAEKNPWNKPNWGNPSKPVATTGQSSFAAQPDRFGMEELKRRHQWTTPAWATVKGKQQSATSTNTAIDEDIIKTPIPKPMLKQTAAGAAAGIKGASSAGANGTGKWSAKNVAAAQAEITAMEQQIAKAKAKAKKEAAAAAEAAALQAEEEARLKNTVEETKLEKARRLAKEREEARWRATLAERNERDKAKREQARLEALQKNSALAPASSDATWGQAHSEQQQRYEERVQQEAAKRQQELDQARTVAIEQEQQQQQEAHYQSQVAEPRRDGQPEYYEEEIVEEYEEEVVEDDDEEELVEYDESSPDSSYPDELQRQIDALRMELASM